MSESSAASSSQPPEPETTEAPHPQPAVRAEQPAKSAEKGSKRSWSVRPRLIDPVRRDAIVAGRPAVLVVDNVSVSFDGFKAITDLTLILDKGELRCLIGPNGAGKTTLMDIITGKTKPDSGTVFMPHDSRDLTQLTEYEIAALGICRKFQRPTVFAGHSVYENMELALTGPKGVWHSLFFRLNGEQKSSIERILEQIGLHEQAAVRAGQLAHGQKQWLEIGMLLAQNPRVLLVDEPIAGMTHQETERTAELLKSLAGERTVVVVEHDMEFVRSIAQKVTVLHEGKVLAEGDIDSVQNNPRVVEVYLGEPRT
ncbi:MAG TPA: urea ABC transporter ATP-binding protein UrtD [Polyangiaceae bacterium]|nr:urea ABC transporter ATP-binding protein UrtD [Polyangiaceae bacterium]